MNHDGNCYDDEGHCDGSCQRTKNINRLEKAYAELQYYLDRGLLTQEEADRIFREKTLVE